jgi:hypothetical protein
VATAAKFDRRRLARLCGMLGSDHAGERANAAKLATDLIHQAGLIWSEVLEHEDGVAVEAEQRLLLENEQLREEIEHLKRFVRPRRRSHGSRPKALKRPSTTLPFGRST